MRRLLCNVIGHHRDRKGARRSIEGWRSTCIICREPLIRITHGDWRPASELDASATDQPEFPAWLDHAPRRPHGSDQ